MTREEKLSMIKSLLGLDATDESHDALLTAYLTAAGQEIISWRFSYGTEEITEVPQEFAMTQVFAVMAGFSQMGGEGQTMHTENGVSLSFKYADMIGYIRANVRPICKVV